MTLTACGALSYIVAIVAAVVYTDCPFQTRISSAIRRTITSSRLKQFLTRISVIGRTIISPRLQQFLTRIPSVIRTTVFPCLQHDEASSDHRRGVSLDPRHGEVSTVSAMEWILKTSTNPDVVRSALELLPSLPTSTNVDLVLLSKRVQDMFKACFDPDGNTTLKHSALAYGKALIHLFCTHPAVRPDISKDNTGWNIWTSWRKLYLPSALQLCEISYRRMVKAREDAKAALELQYQADTRSALRMAVAAGLDRFTNSDDINLVWDGQFQLVSNPPEVDWLMDCAEHFYKINDVCVAGDALLLLSGVPNQPLSLAIRARIAPFLNSSSSDPGSDFSSELLRLRHIALRAAFQSLDSSPCDESFSHAVLNSICPSSPSDCTIRNDGITDDVQLPNAIDLLNFTKWPEGSDLKTSPLYKIQFLILRVLPTPNVDNLERYIPYCNALVRCVGADQLPCLRATALHITRTIREDLIERSVARVDTLRDLIKYDEALLAIFYADGKENSPNLNADDLHYLRFIFAFAKRYGSRLSKHRLIGRYNTIMEHWCSFDDNHQTPSLCTFYLTGILFRIQEDAPDFHVGKNRRWDLLREAWHSADKYDRLYDDDIDILRTLVVGTSMYMPSDVSRTDLEILREWLGNALYQLGSRQPLPDRGIVSAVRALKDKNYATFRILVLSFM
ncbi:hypothetical protein AZE42_08055 [Rhizopogon vesiculosus]|uniref:Uncharacterized protein n=1 Tax=Rhizopogon vesiculosus TaxID=180088 RepID=A0A1J8PVG4_9AGAM|nr:hypothetical protein AZE42_08055 [Rhizopogon vesiculosus]